MCAALAHRAAVVMVGTTHPGNLGAAARALATMGLRRLLLARPLADPGHPDATARAAGATGILERAETYPDLASALGAFHRAFAYTARLRYLSHPPATPRESAVQCVRVLASGRKTALVFGPEHAGLTNAELDMCDAVVTIPSSPEHSSLNIAAAVQVACYELRSAAAGGVRTRERKAPAKEELQRLLEHAGKVIDISCAPPSAGHRRKMLKRLALLLGRADPDRADVQLLRGLLTGTEKLACGTQRTGKLESSE